MSLLVSDNVSGTCPEVVEAVLQASSGTAASYGDDAWSGGLSIKLAEILETDARVFPAVTGTAANALALSALAPSYGNIYYHELSHIDADECGALELFTGGAKLISIAGKSASNALRIRSPTAPMIRPIGQSMWHHPGAWPGRVHQGRRTGRRVGFPGQGRSKAVELKESIYGFHTRFRAG